MEGYLVGVAIKKGLWALAKGITSFVISDKALALEAKFGIHLDPQVFQAAVGSALFAAQHVVHDWLKMKFPNARWL